MTTETARLRAAWRSAEDVATDGSADYLLLDRISFAYAARSHAGLPALVLPLQSLDAGVVGRRASGCELIAHTSLRFNHEGRLWTSPAAALVCTDTEVVDAFAMFASDLLRRSDSEVLEWASVLSIVEEWQTLLARRGRPSAEAEAGLWGELWFLDRSGDVARAIASWRGPDGDATDFFADGVSVDVKASRARRQHHVSLSQVDAPVGRHDAWFLSLWIKQDPVSTETVATLVDRLLERCADASELLRRLRRAGYSHADRSEYSTGFVILDEPEWYAAADVPRVRHVDAGVSQLRYRVTLDEARRAEPAQADRLWRHFLGRDWKGDES